MLRTELRQTRTPGAVLEDLETTPGEYLGAVLDETLFLNPTPALLRLSGNARGLGLTPLSALSRPDLVSPEEATAQYEHLGLGFDRPIDRRTLDKIVDRKRREIVRKSVIERANVGPGTVAAGFGVSLIGTMIDPVNIAAVFIPGGAEALAAKFGLAFKGGTTLARVADAAKANRFLSGAIEGAVGSAAIEPIILAAASQDQTDYGLSDSLLNFALSGIIGGGIHGLAGLAESRRAQIRAADIRTLEAAFKASVAQFAEGRRVDVDQIFDLDIRYRNAAERVAASELDHVGVPIETLTPQAQLVLAARNSLGGFETGPTVTLGDLRRLNFTDEQVQGIVGKRADAIRADLGDRALTAAQVEAAEKGLPISLLTSDQTFRARARGISRGVTVDDRVPLSLARDVGADTEELTARFATERFGLPTADEIKAAAGRGADLEAEVRNVAAVKAQREGVPGAKVQEAVAHYNAPERSSLYDSQASARVKETLQLANDFDKKETLASIYQSELADFQSRVARLGIDPEDAAKIVDSFDPEKGVEPEALAKAHENAAFCIARNS